MTKGSKNEKKTNDIGEEIYRILEKARALQVESREVSIKAPENSGTFNAAVKLNRGASASRKILFPLDVERITIHSLGPSKFAQLDDLVEKVSNGFQLHINKISKDVEDLLLTIEYKIQDMSFLDNIVQTDVAAEPSGESDSYWMHAQLKDLKSFMDRYDRWELLETPFNVDVAIESEVTSSIPRYFVRHLRLLRQLIGARERGRIAKLSMMVSSSRRKIGGDPHSLISSLEGLFDPTQFKRFVEVSKPFKYSDSKKGGEYLDFPTGIFPKTMKVTSRTKLDLKTPASEGRLVYKKRTLYEEISKIFES